MFKENDLVKNLIKVSKTTVEEPMAVAEAYEDRSHVVKKNGKDLAAMPSEHAAQEHAALLKTHQPTHEFTVHKLTHAVKRSDGSHMGAFSSEHEAKEHARLSTEHEAKRKNPKKSFTYHVQAHEPKVESVVDEKKEPKLGSGGRFKDLVNKLKKEKHPPSDPKAVAAAIGRARYGNAKMSKMAHAHEDVSEAHVMVSHSTAGHDGKPLTLDRLKKVNDGLGHRAGVHVGNKTKVDQHGKQYGEKHHGFHFKSTKHAHAFAGAVQSYTGTHHDHKIHVIESKDLDINEDANADDVAKTHSDMVAHLEKHGLKPSHHEAKHIEPKDPLKLSGSYHTFKFDKKSHGKKAAGILVRDKFVPGHAYKARDGHLSVHHSATLHPYTGKHTYKESVEEGLDDVLDLMITKLGVSEDDTSEDMMSGDVSGFRSDDTHLVVAGSPGFASKSIKLKPNDPSSVVDLSGFKMEPYKAKKDLKLRKVGEGTIEGKHHHVFASGAGTHLVFPSASTKKIKESLDESIGGRRVNVSQGKDRSNADVTHHTYVVPAHKVKSGEVHRTLEKHGFHAASHAGNSTYFTHSDGHKAHISGSDHSVHITATHSHAHPALHKDSITGVHKDLTESCLDEGFEAFRRGAIDTQTMVMRMVDAERTRQIMVAKGQIPNEPRTAMHAIAEYFQGPGIYSGSACLDEWFQAHYPSIYEMLVEHPEGQAVDPVQDKPVADILGKDVKAVKMSEGKLYVLKDNVWTLFEKQGVATIPELQDKSVEDPPGQKQSKGVLKTLAILRGMNKHRNVPRLGLDTAKSAKPKLDPKASPQSYVPKNKK